MDNNQITKEESSSIQNFITIIIIMLLVSFAFSSIIIEFHLSFTFKDPVVWAIIFIDMVIFVLFIIGEILKKQKH